MDSKLAVLAAALVGAARAQQMCTLTTETHPPLQWSKCASGGSCSAVKGAVTVDANWRWTHSVSAATNCYTGNTWDPAFCTTNEGCASNCCVDGADYSGTYGVTTSNDKLNLQFVTKGSYSTNIGSRLYLMESDTKYQMFNLLGNEFTFDVDVSNLPCGLNGALYFVSMEADGGLAKYPGNKAGAKYGTGYCDAQCPRDLKFIGGKANVEGWTPSTGDKNAGVGPFGTCCAEMDIWEANSMATAYTPHPCSPNEATICSGDSCGGTYSNDRYGGVCDPDGCDFNSYRQGNTSFYGPGKIIDTKSKFTVVTQFIKDSSGALGEIKRFYVQNGKVFANSQSTVDGVSGNSITTDYCDNQKAAFGDITQFQKKGGLAQMGKALDKGMVLVMSVWDDHNSNMLWLDSTFPVDGTQAGVNRGACATSSGAPDDLEKNAPSSNVAFSNIRFGPIGSTFSSGTVPVSSSSSVPSSTRVSTPSSTSVAGPGPTGTGAKQWEQCGGKDWKGATTCQSPFVCKVLNDYYSQCQ